MELLAPLQRTLHKSAPQRLGKAGEAILGAALGTIPGVGNTAAKGITKIAEDQGKVLDKVIEEGAEASNKAISNIAKAREAGDKAAEKAATAELKRINDPAYAQEALESAFSQPADIGIFQRAMNRISRFDPVPSSDEIKKMTEGASKKISESAKATEKTAEEALEEEAKSLKKSAADKAKDIVFSTPRTLAGMSLPLADSYLAALGNYGVDEETLRTSPIDAFAGVLGATAENGKNGTAYLPFTLPMLTLGTRRLTNRILPNVNRAGALLPQKVKRGSGQTRPLIGSRYLTDIPFQAARASAVGNAIRNTTSNGDVPEPEMSDEEFIARLRAAGGVQ